MILATLISPVGGPAPNADKRRRSRACRPTAANPSCRATQGFLCTCPVPPSAAVAMASGKEAGNCRKTTASEEHIECRSTSRPDMAI